MSGNFFGRFQVCFQNRVGQADRPCKLAGVNVNRDQRLGLVYNQRAARRQRNFALEQALNIGFNLELLENRLFAVVQLNPVLQVWGQAGNNLVRPGIVRRRVNHQTADIGAERIA